MCTLLLCVQARAAKVLQGVKERGKTRGDIMDAQTEAELRPQILQEAFAREVVAMVSVLTTAINAIITTTSCIVVAAVVAAQVVVHTFIWDASRAVQRVMSSVTLVSVSW
jgi:hypothetical protein